MKNKHHIIFEGPELAGKTWIMQQIYNHLEPKYNTSKVRLDGCYWLPSDIGVFGSVHGRAIIKSYLEIFKELENSNYIMEKLHISDIVYSRIHRGVEEDYSKEEKILNDLNFKIVLITYPDDEMIVQERIKGRLDIYSHYENILQKPGWYLKQREEYLNEVKKTKLPYKIFETTKLPDEKLVNNILEWLGEQEGVLKS